MFTEKCVLTITCIFIRHLSMLGNFELYNLKYEDNNDNTEGTN